MPNVMVLFTVLMVLSCSSAGGKKGEDGEAVVKERKGYSVEKGRKVADITLTELKGQNQDLAGVEPDQVVYSSAKRESHDHAQIYRFSFKDKKEYRITFSDGNSLRPIWNSKASAVIYSSDTDESKERSEFIIKNIDPAASSDDHGPLRSELYMSDIFGNKIRRLTKEPGFDGDQDYQPGKNFVVFVSARDGGRDLYLMFLNSGSTQRITSTKEDESQPRFSPDGKRLAWVESVGSLHTLIVGWPGKKREVLLSIKDVSLENLSWGAKSDTLYFDSTIANGIPQIFEIQTATKCFRRITFTSQTIESPVVLGSDLLFLVKKPAGSFIGRMPVPEPSDKCIDIALDPLIVKE